MNPVTLIFSHQLFSDPSFEGAGNRVTLVEEDLYFRQYPFHKSKLVFHHASMKYYQAYLEERRVEVNYRESGEQGSDIRELLPLLAAAGVREIRLFDPVDDWLEKRLKNASHNVKSMAFFWSRTVHPSAVNGPMMS